MQEKAITSLEAGQRFDKYLRRILPEANTSFLYKMLRKKNITLNGQKAEGKEILAAGDVVKVFFSDETYAKMGGALQEAGAASARSTFESGRMQEAERTYRKLESSYPGLRILYENEHMAAVYKPAGVLSQKARPEDISLNEWFLGLLLERGEVTEQSLRMFTPSVQNRLDRNTEGIVLLAKTLPGSHLLTRLQREHKIRKYYHMIVVGRVEKAGVIEGYLSKDTEGNTVRIFPKEEKNTVYTRTEYRPLRIAKLQESTKAAFDEDTKGGSRDRGRTGRISVTCIEAQLITGKTHQLRAHFASIGHPILGDPKYGDPAINRQVHGQGIRTQLLLCQRVEFPEHCEGLEDLNGRVITCEEPKVYRKLMGS